jgi:hypothetical protein
MLASPLEQDTKVDITDLTHASIDGNGVFDVLMRAVNAHLQKEWSANRLKGTEYSTVYLGALESTMNASLQFLLARDKTNAEIDILKQQLVNLKVEEANAINQGAVLTNQAAQIAAQTSLTTKQELQVVAETLNVPKQGALIDAQKDVQVQQKLNLEAQKLNIPKEGALVDAQKALTDQKLLTEQDALLTAAAQRNVLTAQATGFTRDAEQKAAEIMLRGFSVVATTTEMDTAAASLYGISQTGVRNVLGKLAAGVGTTASTVNG